MSLPALCCQTRATGVRTAAALSDLRSVNLRLSEGHTRMKPRGKHHTDELWLSSRDLVNGKMAIRILPRHLFHGRLSNSLIIKHTILTRAGNCSIPRDMWASAAVTCTSWMIAFNVLHQRSTALDYLSVLTLLLRRHCCGPCAFCQPPIFPPPECKS